MDNIKVRQKIIATSIIAGGISAHFFGYECSRAASIALLASKEVGLGKDALPYTVALGSPASALVLYLYARSIRLHGTRYTLRVSELICFGLFLAIIIWQNSFHGTIGNFIVIFFYCFREIYVSLLSTQYWSLIASILDKNTSNYLVKFTAVVSIASAVGGCCVQYLVNMWGVRGLLITTIISLVISSLSSEVGFLVLNGLKEDDIDGLANSPKNKPKTAHRGLSVWRESLELMKKHHILQLLYVEAIAHQTCSNMLNMMFHDMLQKNIIESSERASIVGHFYATVNTLACALQCFVLPSIVSTKSLPYLLIMIPSLIVSFIIIAYMYSSSLTIMIAFGSLKILEYSVMNSAMEMIYMPFTEDVRYLGKELVKFFGGKLGRSGSSLVLSALSAHFQPNLLVQTVWAGIIGSAWTGCMYNVCSYLRHYHPTINVHKKYDDFDIPPSVESVERISEDNKSITTSESSSSLESRSSFSSIDNVNIEDISPPDGWATNENLLRRESLVRASSDGDGYSVRDAMVFESEVQGEPLGLRHRVTRGSRDSVEATQDHYTNIASNHRIHTDVTSPITSSPLISSPSRPRSLRSNPNFMFRIGSTHVNLHTLVGLEKREKEGNPNNEGLYW